ncbi:uncharacterized protein LOC144455673 [Phascolarctos cinereus]
MEESKASGILEPRLPFLVRPVPEAGVFNLRTTERPEITSQIRGASPSADKRARAPNFPPSGPLLPRAPQEPPPARPAHLALAAQLPEELLVLELALLVRDDPRHLLAPGRARRGRRRSDGEDEPGARSPTGCLPEVGDRSRAPATPPAAPGAPRSDPAPDPGLPFVSRAPRRLPRVEMGRDGDGEGSVGRLSSSRRRGRCPLLALTELAHRPLGRRRRRRRRRRGDFLPHPHPQPLRARSLAPPPPRWPRPHPVPSSGTRVSPASSGFLSGPAHHSLLPLTPFRLRPSLGPSLSGPAHRPIPSPPGRIQAPPTSRGWGGKLLFFPSPPRACSLSPTTPTFPPPQPIHLAHLFER